MQARAVSIFSARVGSGPGVAGVSMEVLVMCWCAAAVVGAALQSAVVVVANINGGTGAGRREQEASAAFQ